MTVNYFFADWEPVLRIVVVGTLAYLTLVVMLRASGKRTLAQMNSFDFVITVAIGAAFGRILTTRAIPLVEAVTAFALLILLQYLVTSLQLRSGRFSRIVTAEPRLLLLDGQIMHDALRRERLTEGELRGAIRKHGVGSLEEAGAVIMESDGNLSVIKAKQMGDRETIQGVGD